MHASSLFTRCQPGVRRRVWFWLVPALLFWVGDALARPGIRDSFFARYPGAVGSKLDNLPSKTKHCGVCHFDFNGGGTRNPYGLAIENSGYALNKEPGITDAINSVAPLDSDTDSFTSITEITGTNLGYSNVPTFPGLSSANVGSALNIPLAEINPYLTPTTAVDNTPPTITVLAPNGGESLTANAAATITWSGSDASGITGIRIEESLDGGGTYRPVAIGVPHTGSFTWFPANRPTTQGRIRLIATDGAGNSNSDISNANFAIVSPPGGRVPTTLRDFDMPGTQPHESGPEATPPGTCGGCHGGYDAAVEPYRNWRGSMMALASLDPLFEANLAIANQDAPDSGDLCLRCHISNGWLQGRSVPTSGAAMLETDKIGVSCDLCHRMVDPNFVAGNPARDQEVLAALSFPFTATASGPQYGNGMYVLDPSAIQRGPFADAAAPHLFTASPFHRSSAFCGTCHDVSNPAFSKDANGIYQPNTLDARNNDFSPHSMGPVERTYSEWLHSAYNGAGVYAPEFAGNKGDGLVATCQDCHLRDVSGYGCNPATNPGVTTRPNLPLHDMTGGSTWIGPLIAARHPDKVDAAAVTAAVSRAQYMLQNAADLSPRQDIGKLVVRVTNQTGHKLPTGYPEGRRIWINVKFYNAADVLVGESGAYDAATGVLTHDDEAKIYEVHPGIDTNINVLVGLPVGPSLHFVLNNKIFEDNRIPPRGFTNAAFAAFGGAPVGHSYADAQYWDDSAYLVPPGATRAEVRLHYQSTTKEFVEFLRDENAAPGYNQGDAMYDLWANNGKCPPTLMAAATYAVLDATGDADGDGLTNLEEHAYGCDAHSSGSASRPSGLRLLHESQEHLGMRYVRQKNLAGAQIVVEVSEDLANWVTGAEVAAEIEATDNGDGTETVVVRAVDPMPSNDRQFMRLRIEML